jgi:hypothetical protein
MSGVRGLRSLGVLALLALTGCFQANLELKVYLNGRVEQILTLTPAPGDTRGQGIVEQFAGQLADQGWKLERDSGKIVARRDLKGPGWDSEGLNLGTGTFSDERFRVSRRGGWLMETYRLEVSLGQPNPAFGAFSPAGQLFSLFSASLLPDLSLSLQTPLRASAHNADRVEGTTYTWNVNLAGPNAYYIEYRIVRWDRVALLVLGAAALVAAGLWYRHSRFRR